MKQSKNTVVSKGVAWVFGAFYAATLGIKVEMTQSNKLKI